MTGFLAFLAFLLAFIFIVFKVHHGVLWSSTTMVCLGLVFLTMHLCGWFAGWPAAFVRTHRE